MIMGEDGSPGTAANPLAQFITLADSVKEDESTLAITRPAGKKLDANNEQNNQNEEQKVS